MTRARILADYVSSGDELALKAPLISPALVTPNLGTPSAGTMTNVTGIPAAQVGGVLPVGVTGGSGLDALGGTPTFAGLTSTQDIVMTEGKRVTFAASKIHVNGAQVTASTANARIPRFTATVDTVGTGVTYLDSAANGASFTIATAGLYYVTYNAVFTLTNWFGISLNSTQLSTNVNSITDVDRLVVATTASLNTVDSVSVIQRFAVNDVLRPHISNGTLTTATGAAGTAFIIERIGA